MTTSAEDFGFYAILTNPVRGYAYCANVIVDAGIRYLQLRMKEQPPSDIRRTADELRKITDGTPTRFIINDDPELAVTCGADGVHIGQGDMSYPQARRIIGPDGYIGISTHSPLQTAEACKYAPAYIGVGPVFPTPTKKNPDPVIGIDGMKRMLAVATVPAVAIGGIDCAVLPSVLEAGACNFCMVREVTLSDDPARAVRDILQIYRNFHPHRK